MAIRAKIRLGGLLAATLALPFCGAGTSRAQSSVINGQLQLGDVISNQTLNVEDASDGVSAASTAVGNIVSAIGQNAPIDVRSDQSVNGHVEASVNAEVKGASGDYFATSAEATGNSATAGTCCYGTTGSSLQTVEHGAVVAGDAISKTGGAAGSISVDAAAVGNTTGWEQIGGSVQSWTGQTNAGLTTATNSGAFASTTGNTGLSSTSVSNNVTGDIVNATIDIGVGQEMIGEATNAVIDVTLASGADIQGLASGVGNNVDIQASSGDNWTNVQQINAAPVNAYSNLTVTGWTGDAVSTAYGVGNSVVMSNNGGFTGMWTDQKTTGDINVSAAFTGGTGSTVYASSTAMGNAVSGYACSECGGEINATNRQTGGSRVRANSAINITGKVRAVAADATAVGNNATYQVFSGN